jgi:prepilin-type processing-associated H-X9-DG protein
MSTPTPCDEWVERLSAYADGELAQLDCFAIDEHLGACEACREWMRVVKEDARLYAEAYAEPARGDDYLKAVLDKLPGTQTGQPARRGFRFTLVELAACAAIVGILGAVTFPVFSRAREKARQVSCQSNLKQLALAMHMFAEDHEGHLPSALTWQRDLYPYTKNEQLLKCPSDESDQACSYAMNVRLSKANLNSLSTHAEEIVLYDADASGAPVKRHNDGLDIAFADGHVKWYREPPKPLAGGVSLGARDRNYGLADKLHLSYDAALTVRTDDALASLRLGEEILRENGGFVLQADFHRAARLATATLSCKVPAGNLEATLAALSALGATVSQQLAGKDMTQQFVDVETALRRESDKQTELSREARRTGDREQRAAVRAALEQSEENTLGNRRKQYEVLSQTVLATVSVTFESPVPRPSGGTLAASALRSGWHWSGRTLGVAGAWALGFAPVWVPVVLVVWIGRVWVRRRRTGSI